MKRARVFVAAALLGSVPAGHAAAEFCGDTAPDGGFPVERVWPVDCSTTTPLDALVYVAGAAAALSVPSDASTLSVSVSPSQDREACGETLAGDIEFVQGGSVALWRGATPFAAHTEYTLTAQRRDPDGQPNGAVLRSTFVTGESFMQPIKLRGELDVTSRSVHVPMQACSYDACGASDCHDGEGEVERTRVSIYVPPLDGGLPAAQGDTFDTRYEVVAVFAEAPGGSGQHVFASAKQSITRLTHAMVELDIPVLPEAFEGCALVTVSDLTGASLELPAQCLTISPAAEPAYARSIDAASADDERLDVQADAGGGCNAAGGRPNLPIMLAALLILLARRRLPF